MPIRSLALVSMLVLCSCSTRAPRAAGIPFTPNGQDWIDLLPGMGLRVENAYFREGAARHTVDEFIGTEAAEYTVDEKGHMAVAAFQSKIARRPADQAPVQSLIPAALARFHVHRFYYQVVFNRSTRQMSGAVLLGARSKDDLASLASRMFADPDSVCGGPAAHCRVFPEVCSASVQMTITVNGEPRRVLWGSLLSSVAIRPTTVELLRLAEGRLKPMEIDLQNPSALHITLLPGDRVNWQ